MFGQPAQTLVMLTFFGSVMSGNAGYAEGKMGKLVMAALWLAVVSMLSLQVRAEQIGQGLGKDNLTFTEAFPEDLYYQFFPHMNDPIAHAQGFYEYEMLVTAASMFAKQGFGLVGGSTVQKKEIAAFLAHAAHDTTCNSLSLPLTHSISRNYDYKMVDC
jgi:hypothetical protein